MNIGSSAPVLTDRQGRHINYLRLAVTDRCNLRCTYCMPADGVVSLNHSDILTFQEMFRLVTLLSPMGVTKVRITGGEPFVRKGLLPFLQRLHTVEGIGSLHITTNGVETAPHIPLLEKMNIGVNLSLDTLRPERFQQITRRARFEQVQETLNQLLTSSIKLKINSVIQFGTNDDEIGDLARLAMDNNVDVRFIEEMPFNGRHAIDVPTNHWIEQRLVHEFPGMGPEGKSGTAQIYDVPGFRGRIGIISGAERTFCGSCNRLRITADGRLKTCLYDDGVLDLRSMLRSGASDEEIAAAIRHAVVNRHANGYEAERAARQQKSSMSQIGG